ncbi:hypothetical protein MASR1M32_16430 [Rhodobacter sp.]
MSELRQHISKMQDKAIQLGNLATALSTMMFEEERRNLCFHLLDGIEDLAREINNGLDASRLPPASEG